MWERKEKKSAGLWHRPVISDTQERGSRNITNLMTAWVTE